jgi:hypothetical protein
MKGADTIENGKEVGKGCRRMKIVQILYIHVYKWKNDTC